MGFLNWDDSLSVGVRSLDQQHQKLIDMINQLHDAMKERKAKEQLSSIIKGLVDYTTRHFADEERYFDKFNYPDAAAHKQDHQKFVKEVQDFKTKFEKENLALSIQIMNFLKDWLVKHIKGADQKYKKCFADNGLS